MVKKITKEAPATKTTGKEEKKKEKIVAYECIKTCVFTEEKISFTAGQIIKKSSDVALVKGSKHFKLL